MLPTTDLADLRVVAIDAASGSARLMNPAGNTATVTVGDAIGAEAAEVVKIKRAYILVKTEGMLTRMPLNATALAPGGQALDEPAKD